jgi:hypothetical protein
LTQTAENMLPADQFPSENPQGIESLVMKTEDADEIARSGVVEDALVTESLSDDFFIPNDAGAQDGTHLSNQDTEKTSTDSVMISSSRARGPITGGHPFPPAKLDHFCGNSLQ